MLSYFDRLLSLAFVNSGITFFFQILLVQQVLVQEIDLSLLEFQTPVSRRALNGGKPLEYFKRVIFHKLQGAFSNMSYITTVIAGHKIHKQTFSASFWKRKLRP